MIEAVAEACCEATASAPEIRSIAPLLVSVTVASPPSVVPAVWVMPPLISASAKALPAVSPVSVATALPNATADNEPALVRVADASPPCAKAFWTRTWSIVADPTAFALAANAAAFELMVIDPVELLVRATEALPLSTVPLAKALADCSIAESIVACASAPPPLALATAPMSNVPALVSDTEAEPPPPLALANWSIAESFDALAEATPKATALAVAVRSIELVLLIATLALPPLLACANWSIASDTLALAEAKLAALAVASAVIDRAPPLVSVSVALPSLAKAFWSIPVPIVADAEALAPKAVALANATAAIDRLEVLVRLAAALPTPLTCASW